MVTCPDAAADKKMTSVGTCLAAICDTIQEHRKCGRPIDDDDLAAISAMIEDLAATAEGRPTTKLRVCRSSACSSYYSELDDEEEELGVGAFGVVIRARHRDTGEVVAVKTLHSEHGDVGLSRLLREASFMAACGAHPSLVALRGVERITPGETDFSLVMEYVGPTLLDVLRARAPQAFPEAEVRAFMRQLLAGAQEMHRHGVVHRDIKCENILVAGSGHGGGEIVVKICDLGSAKSTAERRPMFDIAGTMEYMAPEVLAEDAGHGAPADAWSLGCVMAELLTGEPPFRGVDEADQLLEIFGVLGAPEESVWRAMRPRRVLVAGEVNVLRQRQRETTHRSGLRVMFSEEVLSREGFEVLEGLLTCDPEKRMTAAAALRCRWFAADDNYKLQEQCHETTASLPTMFAACGID